MFSYIESSKLTTYGIKSRTISRNNFIQLNIISTSRQVSVFSNESLHRLTISRWYGEYKSGRTSLSNDIRTGPPKTPIIPENANAVRKLIKEDQRVTLRHHREFQRP